jgi:hypothetical protein
MQTLGMLFTNEHTHKQTLTLMETATHIHTHRERARERAETAFLLTPVCEQDGPGTVSQRERDTEKEEREEREGHRMPETE